MSSSGVWPAMRRSSASDVVRRCMGFSLLAYPKLAVRRLPVFPQGSGKQASTSGEVIVGGGGGGKDNVEALTPEQALDRFMACGIDSVGE